MKANVQIAAFFVSCPKCNTEIASPTGSLMWATNERYTPMIECPNLECRAMLSLPVKYTKLMDRS